VQLLSPPPTRLVLLVIDEGLTLDQASAEVVRCASQDEAMAALGTGRRYSALVATAPGPPLRAAARRARIPLLAPESAIQLGGAGGSAGLSDVAYGPAGGAGVGGPGEAGGFARAQVVVPVRRGDIGPSLGPAPAPVWAWGGAPGDAPGRLVAVGSTGGTGASVLAAALTVSPLGSARVLLADLARRADQAFLHGLGETAGGLLDLVERGRYRPVSPADVRPYTMAIPGAWLLPGLRRPHHWTAVSPTVFDAVLAALRLAFDLVVADVTADLEGERDGGSIDVEERNHMGRHTTAAADVVVVVGGPGANGIRRLAGLVDELLDHGVDPARLLPVVNRASAGDCLPRLCGLPQPTIGVPTVAGSGLLPARVVSPVAAAITGLLAESPAAPPPALVPVVPGSLGYGIR
jgi:MinD-like ATPase involved in chromosome partitioning or flagellar assembly